MTYELRIYEYILKVIQILLSVQLSLAIPCIANYLHETVVCLKSPKYSRISQEVCS